MTTALPWLTRAKCHGLVEGEEMTLLDEKIAALFRKSSPISAGAEPAPSVDGPVEEAASEAVVTAVWNDDIVSRAIDP